MKEEEFVRRYLRHLNPQQRAAVLSEDGPVLILATPGSGKTTVLVMRLGFLLLCRGVDPKSLLTMTYTRAATRDMRLRFEEYFGAELAEGLQFRTINGVSAGIISRAGRMHGRVPFSVLEEGERTRILRSVWQAVHGEYPEDSDIRELSASATRLKNMLLSEEEIEKLGAGSKRLPELYAKYQEELRSRKAMDYDDQMIYALRLLRRFPDLLDAFRDRYRYLCVDEAQDSSLVQHEIIRLLAARDRNLFMVGDEDQSIYGFRGANPDALLQFEEHFPGAQVLLLEENYRSTPEIILAANRFIAANRHRRPKAMIPTRGSGAPVRFLPVSTRAEQYEQILSALKSWKKETAILYRNNDTALPLIDRLEAAGIPYNCRNFEEVFFSHRVVTDITDFLLFSLNLTDADRFLRLYYKLGLGISKNIAVRAAQQSRITGKSPLSIMQTFPDLRPRTLNKLPNLVRQFNQLKKDSASTALRRIWEDLQYGKYVKDRGLDSGKYFILSQLAEGVPDVPSLLQKLDHLQNIVAQHENSPENRIILSTIHSSKGLEYDSVWILDAIDGILPSVSAAVTDEQQREYEEERRLFYVAITRAKDELVLFLTEGGSFPAELSAACERDAENRKKRGIFSFRKKK